MNRTLLRLTLAAALLGMLGLYLIYRSRPQVNPSIDSHAQEVIDKAKAR